MLILLHFSSMPEERWKMNDFGKKIYVFAIICLMYFPHDVVPYYQYPSVYWAPKNCRYIFYSVAMYTLMVPKYTFAWFLIFFDILGFPSY